MRLSLAFAIGLLLGASVMALPKLVCRAYAALKGLRQNAAAKGDGNILHTEQKFTFVARAPVEVVAPLFGAHKERVWAPGWDPSFIWPAMAHDRQGMVFTVPHGHQTAVWVASSFEPLSGRVQYVYVLPDVMATVITLEVTPEENQTRVKVEYDRTALRSSANDLVRRFSKEDDKSGPEWEKQINDYLETVPK